jgi:hypothetical protein
VGGLPEDEQGSYALIVASAHGGLVKMPMVPAPSNRIERQVAATLAAQAQLSAHVDTKFFGQSASEIRGLLKSTDPDRLKHYLERIYSRRLGAVTLDKIAPADRADRTQFDLAVDVEVTQFGQFMQDRMLVIEPGNLAPLGDYNFANKPRRLPVKLDAAVDQDSVTIKLPAGFAPDEMPAPVQLKTAYGSYEAKWQVSAGDLRFEQSLKLNDVLAPASEYAKIRAFFDRVMGSQNAAVVLLKK